jgi:hypothetical protein
MSRVGALCLAMAMFASACGEESERTGLASAKQWLAAINDGQFAEACQLTTRPGAECERRLQELNERTFELLSGYTADDGPVPKDQLTEFGAEARRGTSITFRTTTSGGDTRIASDFLVFLPPD